jgi:hypothetical protein
VERNKFTFRTSHAHVHARDEFPALVIQCTEQIEGKKLARFVSGVEGRVMGQLTRAAMTCGPGLDHQGLPRSFIWKHPGSFSPAS